MQAQLYADLEKKIQEWVDEHCGGELWPEIFIGVKTVEHMTKASASVFDACLESQKYAEEEGYFKE